MTVTQEYVHELFDYDPWSGEVIRLVSRGRFHAGDAAGRIHPSGYRFIQIDGRNYTATHLIWVWMTGEWPEETIDHRDLNRSNDRWRNLRPANYSEQNMNQGIRRTCSSGVKGVCWEERSGKWRAYIWARGVHRHLGYFDRFEDAVTARRAAEQLYHGRFARAA